MLSDTQTLLLTAVGACGLAALVWGLTGAPLLPRPATPPRARSAQTQDNCRALYPADPALAQACVRRWTTGDTMPGPSAPPAPTAAETARVLVQWCAGLAGIPPVSRERPLLTRAQLHRLTTCVDERMPRLTTTGR